MAKAKTARKSAKKKRSRKPSKAAKAMARRAPKKAAAKRAKKRPARKKASRKPRKARKAAASGKLLTLTEVSKRTGISMPTLQRYKKEYQSRLPTVGKGRSQRYPVAALPIFKKIKQENLKKRGRPRKSAAPARKKVRRQKRSKSGGSVNLISLSEIGRRTGISYPTLLRYGRLYGDRIPSHGTGRKRRFPESAVPVFQQLRQQSRRGRRKGSGAKRRSAGAGAGLAARVRRLEARNARLEKQMKALVKALRKPLVGRV